MKKNKQKRLLKEFRKYIRIPAILIAFLLAVMITLTILFAIYNVRALLIALVVTAGVSLLVYVAIYFMILKRLTHTFYKQLYETTYSNLTKIKNNEVGLISYGDSDIREIQMLDKATSDLRKKLNSSYLITYEPDYNRLNLEYVDKEKNLITFKSFKDNLSNIIFVSQSFRNVLIEVYYEFPADIKFTKKDKTRILDLYRQVFSDHEGVLFMFAEDDKSLLIYVPVCDSFNEIKEKLGYAVTNSSITIRDDRGIRHILAKYAVVSYPYSNEEMLLGDLTYAKRQNEPYLLFLPQRHRENIGKDLMLNTTMNINYTSKVMVELSKLDYSTTDNEKNKVILRAVFDAITNFLDLDEGGIIAYDDTSDCYYSYIAARRNKLFTGKNISKDLVETLAKAVDDDNSNYFSTKRHASPTIKRVLDMYGISSGEYYIVKSMDESRVVALVYLLNRERDLKLTTYLREMFFIISLRIENYFEKREIADFADNKLTENNNILALSNLYSYHIDSDYRFTEFSKSIKHKFPNIKLGETCHKFFFDKDSPCKDCPLKTRQKKYFIDKGAEFESSLVLADRRDKDWVILVKQLTKNEQIGDLFHPDLLTYSFRAFTDLVRNEYAANERGYIVLLCIDNYEQIVAEKGPEGYTFYLREYVRNVKNKLNTEEVYFYNPSTLAIHLPYEGHANTINKIETIYPLSKQNIFKQSKFNELKITYLSIGYPRGYATPDAFLKHVSDCYINPDFERNKDFIYFSDYAISRSASKREFMVSVLEQEFSGHNSTSMYLQPIVSIKNNHIMGAEILLRIEDVHRNVFFNALEISRIAEQEGKTQLVTESIINFIGNLYREYGKGVFKINKFNRIAINIDQTYLGDDKLLQELVKLTTENNLPKGFISMEIPEDVIPNNKDKIKHLADELRKYEIMFSCDRYMGQYVDIEELSNLGFKEVKVARDIILKIDKDPVKYDSMRHIVNLSKKNGIDVAAVGVENEEQVKLLKNLDENIIAQGYYYYKALSRSDLIAALISYEK